MIYEKNNKYTNENKAKIEKIAFLFLSYISTKHQEIQLVFKKACENIKAMYRISIMIDIAKNGAHKFGSP